MSLIFGTLLNEKVVRLLLLKTHVFAF